MPRQKKTVTNVDGTPIVLSPLDAAKETLNAATKEVVKLPLSANIDKLTAAAIAYRELYAAAFK